MRRTAALVALIATCPMIAAAAELRDCDTFEANARNLAFPYESATKTYADGAIGLINLFLEEPVCCGAHLMVLHPAPDDEPFQACTLISREGGLGYAYIAIERASAAYDPARGLTVSLPVGIYDGETAQPHALEVTINQSAGRVTVADK